MNCISSLIGSANAAFSPVAARKMLLLKKMRVPSGERRGGVSTVVPSTPDDTQRPAPCRADGLNAVDAREVDRAVRADHWA